jgi:hypothetical protein
MHDEYNTTSKDAKLTNQDVTAAQIDHTTIDQSIWKKLGVTQAFDLLLVKACMEAPGTPAELCARIGNKLADGAQKFWEMSFVELTRNLKRKELLDDNEGVLVLHAQFHEKLSRAVETFASGNSRVEPGEGVSLEGLEARNKAREQRAQREKERKQAAKAPSRRAQIKPAKRAATVEKSDPLGHEAVKPAVREQPAAVSVSAAPAESQEHIIKKIFTSMRLNRLFDRLEHSTLSIKQLCEKLDLGSGQVDRFLNVCESADLIRIVRTDLIELQWRGREYAATADAERRMGVLALVKELRSSAQETEVQS